RDLLARPVRELEDKLPVSSGKLRPGGGRTGNVHVERVPDLHPGHPSQRRRVGAHWRGLPSSGCEVRPLKALLQRFVTHQAEIRHESIALVLSGQTVSYGELEAWSNQLARLLKAAGCQRGDRVCLLLPKSIPAIVSILGTLKADCVYVPMDIASPALRLATTIQICEARCVLAMSASATALKEVLANPRLPADVRIGWMDSPEATPE